MFGKFLCLENLQGGTIHKNKIDFLVKRKINLKITHTLYMTTLLVLRNHEFQRASQFAPKETKGENSSTQQHYS
jgi:hypothetical protein